MIIRNKAQYHLMVILNQRSKIMQVLLQIILPLNYLRHINITVIQSVAHCINNDNNAVTMKQMEMR